MEKCDGDDDRLDAWMKNMVAQDRREASQVRAHLTNVLRQLESTPDWDATDFYKTLKRDCAGLGEIRFRASNKLYRLLGYREEPKARRFVILLPALKDAAGRRDNPNFYRIHCPRAHALRVRIERGEVEVRDCHF